MILSERKEYSLQARMRVREETVQRIIDQLRYAESWQDRNGTSNIPDTGLIQVLEFHSLCSPIRH